MSFSLEPAEGGDHDHAIEYRDAEESDEPDACPYGEWDAANPRYVNNSRFWRP
jgi:hypothetical protein